MKKNRTKNKASAPPAHQTHESMAALASGMADEFNNILTTVMGACSLIDKDSSANADLQRYVGLIRESAEHAADLSSSLMLVGSVNPENVPSDRNQQINGSVATSVRDKKNRNDIVPSDNQPGGSE